MATRLWGREKGLRKQRRGRNQKDCGESERSKRREFNSQLPDFLLYLDRLVVLGQTLFLP